MAQGKRATSLDRTRCPLQGSGRWNSEVGINKQWWTSIRRKVPLSWEKGLKKQGVFLREVAYPRSVNLRRLLLQHEVHSTFLHCVTWTRKTQTPRSDPDREIQRFSLEGHRYLGKETTWPGNGTGWKRNGKKKKKEAHWTPFVFRGIRKEFSRVEVWFRTFLAA